MKRAGWAGVLWFALILAGCGGGEQRKDGSLMETGAGIYSRHCASCHQANGKGVDGLYPPLSQTEWILGDPGRLVRLLLNGMQGPIQVRGRAYDNTMIPHRFLKDHEIAAVLTFVRGNFGNEAPEVTADQVARVRSANRQSGFWKPEDLEEAVGIP